MVAKEGKMKEKGDLALAFKENINDRCLHPSIDKFTADTAHLSPAASWCRP